MERRARRRYRALLRLAPRRLRIRHAAEMEDAFIDAWRQARHHHAGVVARTWLRAGADLLAARLRRPRSVVPVPPAHRRVSLMLGMEIRAAFRSFRRQPGATALVVTMLTLGIAATTVVFSLVNELFLRPLPFPDPERLVYINERAPAWNLDRTGINFPDFDRWRQGASAFDGLGLYDDLTFNLSDERGAERIAGTRVTHDFLPVLGVVPVAGRLFTPDDDRPNGPRVALISERLWADRFDRSPGALERTLQLNGVAFQIVGVLPHTAEFPLRSHVWIPLAGDPAQTGLNYSFDGIGRVKTGVSMEAAEADLVRSHEPIWQQRDRDRIVTPFLQPLRQRLTSDFRVTAPALLVAVLLLLVLACANVAAIMLARAIARRREMSIRLAVGANRWRLAKQLFVENLLLAAIGGVIGLALGRWTLALLVSAVGDVIPPWATFVLDARIVGFALLVTAGTALLFGSAPAFHALRSDLRRAMTEASAGSTASPSGRRTLTWLVGAEFAVAAVLLVGGGLLLRAFGEVRGVDPGFRPDGAVTFSVALPAATYRDGPARLGFWTRLLDRLRAMPGVESAGVINCAPLGCHWGNFYRIEGRPPAKPGDPDPVILSRFASAGYFEALGLRLREGRFFDDTDRVADAPNVVIVNHTFARTFWPGETQIVGKRIANGSKAPWIPIVGVTEDVKHYGLEQPMRPGVYFPLPQMASRAATMTVAVRTAEPPESFAGAARAAVRDLDPLLPVFDLQPMPRRVAASLQQRATYSWMLGVFAGLALVLALGGTYGVTSYLVTQRDREMGIRAAMGARGGDIVRTVLRGGLMPVAAGVVGGAVAAMALAGQLGDLLFGVSPRDPVVIGIASATLAVAAVLANWIPARRAARRDPMVALRM